MSGITRVLAHRPFQHVICYKEIYLSGLISLWSICS